MNRINGRAFLDSACADDDMLREQVEKLLKAHSQLGTYHGKSNEDVAATQDRAPIEKLGTYIDRYKLVHEIAHGGMGVVYMAMQKEPVKRKVALKIIKPGMDTREVVARFEAERQALALMDHQCIAKVLDGGSTPSGRPYFVMELVEGTPITEYCDECRYATRQRLELFIQVCHAVQHAHQKGVIHRDIKPSNILVTNYDHLAIPKVIDFGIAKALNQQLSEQSLYTSVMQMVGTPLYMSPEQADRTGQDVDTRTDVYSLGVLLYELLTGTTPFDKERLKDSSLDEVKRIICEEEPPKPSARLSTLDAALETVSEKRYTDRHTLTRELTGELDWIAMKALDKARARRYESVSDLSRDVQRYMADEPVEACPPSKAYRLKKFAQRHKSQLITVAMIVAVLLTATIVSSSLAAWAVQESRSATRNLLIAKRNEAIAKEERVDALDARGLAKRQEELARQQRDAAEYNNYISSIRVAEIELDRDEALRAFEALTALAPEPERPDRRGWEWYYLSSRFHNERFAFPFQRAAIAWSTDGKRLATVDQLPGLINIWDVSTGKLPSSLKDCYGNIHCMSWSPDGKYLASAGDRRSIAIWDVGSGERIRSLRGHAAAIRSIDWNPVDARLASGAEDGTIYIWDAETAKCCLSLTAPRPVSSLHWHPDGALILATTGVRFWRSVGEDVSPKARIWDTTTGQEIACWSSQRHARFSPDGGRVAFCVGRAGGGGSLRVRTWETQEQLAETFCSNGSPYAWSPDGTQLVAGHANGVLRFSGAATGQDIRSVLSRAAASSVAWSPKGALLAAAGKDGTVRVWDPTEKRHVRSFSMPGTAMLSAAFAPDSKRLLVGGREGLVKMWNVHSGDEILTLKNGSTWNCCVAWSPDGTRFACRGGEGRIYSAETGELLLALSGAERGVRSLIHRMDWSPDGATLAVTYRRLHFRSSAEDSAPGGAGWPNSWRVRLWDTTTGEMITASGDFPGSRGDVRVFWSPDGKRLLVPAREVGRVFDAALREEAVLSPKMKGPASWSPDGKQVAIGVRDITIVDTASWKPMRVVRGHRQGVRAVSWHPRMPRLATGGNDKTVRIWDTLTGRELYSFEMPEVVTAVTWSPDGRQLAFTGSNGEVRIWDASPALRHLARHGELRENAYDFAKAGEHDKTIRVLERLTELYPEDGLLQTQLARLRWLHALHQTRDGLTDETLAILKRLQAEHPALPDYRVTAANVAFDAGRHAEAFEMLERLVVEQPETLEYREELAYLYEARATALCESGKVEEARPLLRKLAEDFPDRPDFRVEVAFKAAAQGRLARTMTALDGLSDAFERWPDYRPELARHLTETGNVAGTATILKSLLPDTPGISKDTPELARYFLTTKQYAKAEKAIAEIEKLLAKAPRGPEDGDALLKLRTTLIKQLRQDLVGCYFSQSDYDKAIDVLSKLIKQTPDDWSAWNRRGVAYSRIGQRDKAIADYSKAIELKPDELLPRQNRGYAQCHLGRWDEAVADFSKAIELDKDDAVLRYWRALAQLAAKDIDGYRTATAKMLERFGDSKDPKEAHWLAWTCALAPDAIADFSPAVSAAEMAVEKEPQSVAYLKTLPGILYRAGRFEEAVERLAEADKLAEQHNSTVRSSPAYGWYFLALAQYKLGREEEAKQWLDKAAEWTDRVLREDEAGTNTLPWNRRLTLKLLREEAEGMIRVTVDEATGDTQSAKEKGQESGD